MTAGSTNAWVLIVEVVRNARLPLVEQDDRS
jgi:hypothetical protein